MENSRFKFRAWDIEDNRLLEVLAISWNTNDVICFDPNNNPEGDIVIDLNNTTLLQFTGLTDKAGKDIYESDIYKWRDKEIGQIIFADACFDCASDRGRWSLRSIASDLEIIGNLFENPSLLD